MIYDNIDLIIELRKAIIQKMPLQNMKNAIQNISKNELTKIINSYPRNYNNHLTMLNLSQDTVRDGLKKLEVAGLIKVSRSPGQRPLLEINPPPIKVLTKL